MSEVKQIIMCGLCNLAEHVQVCLFLSLKLGTTQTYMNINIL